MTDATYTGQQVPIAMRKFGGGLNSTSAFNLEDNESPDLLNVDFDKYGSVLKRNGYTRLNTSAFNSSAAWNALHWFQMSTGTKFIVGTCGNKFAKMDDLDGTWDDVTGAITITAGNDNHTSFRTFLDTVIGTNNVDLPFKWTGSGNASVLTVPTNLTKAKFVEVFTSYTILANITLTATVHPSRFYWSTINTIETWDAADFIDVAKNDGEAITGLQVLGEELIIFKERSIYKALFTGDRDIPFIIQKTQSEVGASSGYSIQEVKNGLVFRAPDGLYYFDGNHSDKLSDRITRTYSTHNMGRTSNVMSVYQPNKNRYWSTVSTGSNTTTDEIITWDSFNNAFSRYDGQLANCFTLVTVSGEERVYWGDYSGFVYRADTGTNDSPLGVSTAIDAYFYTKWRDEEDLVDTKGIPSVYIYYQAANGTMDFSYSYNFESADTYTQSFSMSAGTALYGTAVYGVDTYAGTGGKIERRDLTGRGKVVRFKFANNRLSETFEVDGLGLNPYLETQV